MLLLAVALALGCGRRGAEGPYFILTPLPTVPPAAATPAPPREDTPRIAGLQKGKLGTASAADVVRFTTPSASMGALPVMAVEFWGDWIAAIVAANNFGPNAESVAGYVMLRDRQGRTFNTLDETEYPDYYPLRTRVQRDDAAFFGDRDLLLSTTIIEPGRDAFVLLIFRVAPDSEDLALAAGRRYWTPSAAQKPGWKAALQR
jgi:hypothetical protein